MEGYGQTECTVAVATYPWMEPKPGSMGMPTPGYDIEIIDEEGNPCEAGNEGEISYTTLTIENLLECLMAITVTTS